MCYDHDYFHLKIDFCKSLLLKRSGGWLFDRFTKHSKIAPLMLNRQKPASPIHYPIFYFLRFHVHVWVGSLIFTVTSKHNSARNSDLALRRCVLCRTFDFNLRPWGHLVATQLAYQRSKIQTFLNHNFWILNFEDLDINSFNLKFPSHLHLLLRPLVAVISNNRLQLLWRIDHYIYIYISSAEKNDINV